MTKPLISVIIPVYNVEKYLKECLDSVLEQTYPNLEVILINDGSTDDSLAISEEYASAHDNIRLFTQENAGQSAARNKGIEEAEGEWLAFVDSDDYIGKNHLTELYEANIKNNTKLSLCKFTRNFEDLSREFLEESQVLTRESSDFISLIDKLYFSGYPILAPVCKLYHQSIFDEIRFPEGIIYEDGLMFYYVMDKVESVSLVDSKSYYYLTNPNSTLNSKISSKNFDVLKKNELLIEFFRIHHPNHISHAYRQAITLNNMIGVKAIGDGSELSKELILSILKQNRIYSARMKGLSKVLYLNKGVYHFALNLARILAHPKMTKVKNQVVKLSRNSRGAK